MSRKKNSQKVIDIERQAEDRWESSLSDTLKHLADNQKPSDQVSIDVEKHYSSPDVPLEPEDQP